jgi:hypothetical protein
MKQNSKGSSLLKALLAIGLVSMTGPVSAGWLADGIGRYYPHCCVEVTQGHLDNQGVRIVADDGSFELKGGQDFTPPFQLDLWSRNSPKFVKAVDSLGLVSSYSEALEVGAKRVRFYTDNNPASLYGIIAFNSMSTVSIGPGAKSYFVQVSPDTIASARAGTTVVSYEFVDWRRQVTGYAPDQGKWYGWVLWLSNRPLN